MSLPQISEQKNPDKTKSGLVGVSGAIHEMAIRRRAVRRVIS